MRPLCEACPRGAGVRATTFVSQRESNPKVTRALVRPGAASVSGGGGPQQQGGEGRGEGVKGVDNELRPLWRH